VAVGIAEEAADLPVVFDRRRQERRAAVDEHLVGSSAVRDPDRELTARLVWIRRGVNVTPGLSGVGPPPVTSSSQTPWNFKTAEVPPYSRTSVAPRMSR